jgi:hypothetical protein
VASLTLQDIYRGLIATYAWSPLVTGVELLLFEEPVRKVHVHLGSSAFLDPFFNAEIAEISFALSKAGQRI